MAQLQDGVCLGLLDAHAKRVNVLVQLVEEGDGLDDHVVHTVDVELDLRWQATRGQR